MAKKGMGLLLAGGAALLLMGGGKKKKKKSSGTGDGSTGDDLLGPGDRPGDGSSSGGSGTGGKGSGTGRPGSGGYKVPNLAPDAIWVSPDCQRVFFAGGRIGTSGAGDRWFDKKALPAIEKFSKAGYDNPYEIARSMVLGMAPCAAEFPIKTDDLNPSEIEYARETFLRKYRDVYILIMQLVESAQSIIGQEDRMISFDPKTCDVVFVGDNWGRPTAETMAGFYLNYMYPPTSPKDYSREEYKASLTSDPKENYMTWADNIAVAILNRFSPVCGSELANAFKKDHFTAQAFFNARPGLAAVYTNLIDLVNYVEDNRPGLDFKLEAIDAS